MPHRPTIVSHRTAGSLPPAWDALAGSNPYLGRRMLSEIEAVRHVGQRYHIFCRPQPDSILGGGDGVSPHYLPSPFDLRLARILYSPHLKPGMGKDEAYEAAARVLDTLDIPMKE